MYDTDFVFTSSLLALYIICSFIAQLSNNMYHVYVKVIEELFQFNANLSSAFFSDMNWCRGNKIKADLVILL